jgi:hypothetical protein
VPRDLDVRELGAEHGCWCRGRVLGDGPHRVRCR